MLLFIKGPKGQIISLMTDSCNGCISSSVLYRFDPVGRRKIPSTFCEPSDVFHIPFDRGTFLDSMGRGLDFIGLWQLMMTTNDFGIVVTSASIILRTQRFRLIMGFTIASYFQWTSDSSVSGQSYSGIGVRKPLTVIASDLRSADESTVKLSYPRHLVSANNLTVLGPSVSDKSACCGDKEGCYVCNITSASQICAMQYHQDSYCGNSADISVSVIKTSCFCQTLVS